MKYYFLALGTLVVVCVGCAADGQHIMNHKNEYVAPPAAMMQRPGPMVDGPGPGVLQMLAPPPASAFAARTSQVRFVGPAGMKIGWQVAEGYAENQITAPGRYNFNQGATYRLKFADIPGRSIPALYPSLQVYPSHPTTDAYLSHNSIPLEITPEDLDQVESNNFVTKVIYLPDEKFQELAIAGVETLVSTRLEPGVDPVAEADRRGTIMAVLRIGNMDLEMPASGAEKETVSQVSYDGDAGAHMPPMPIPGNSIGVTSGVPVPTMVGGMGAPGQPAYNPIAGMGPTPAWGMPMTGTPIGLPGPPHIPLGGPASLKSHTIRNRSKTNLPKPVDHFLVDVKQNPPPSLPKPVKYVQYSESHPVHAPGQVSYPRTMGPGPGY